ncbi:MAG: 16S rRNA (guanine(966)-N(2))-methyltransferase RsmD [Nitrospirales bacterium]|nr:16S rRNA (guanine(966)-N(2))-methyltransferase RsmD [Nitrospirales bacterium]
MKPSSIRIVGGALKGRTISIFPEQSVRPTSQRAREAILGILDGRINRATVADFFSGTGAMGIEALSRGAARVAFVDHQKELQLALYQTLSRLTLLPQSLVITADIHLAIQNQNLLGWRPFDVLFLDPPYQFPKMDQILTLLEGAQLMTKHGLIIYEHFHKTISPAAVGTWSRVRKARYGDTAFTFYETSTGS